MVELKALLVSRVHASSILRRLLRKSIPYIRWTLRNRRVAEVARMYRQYQRWVQPRAIDTTAHKTPEKRRGTTTARLQSFLGSPNAPNLISQCFNPVSTSMSVLASATGVNFPFPLIRSWVSWVQREALELNSLLKAVFALLESHPSTIRTVSMALPFFVALSTRMVEASMLSMTFMMP